MHARNSLQALTDDCKKRGVRFVSGPAGTVKSFEQGVGGKAIVVAEDGTRYEPEKVVVAAGAWMDSLFDTKGQLLAKWYVNLSSFTFKILTLPLFAAGATLTSN